MGPEMELERNDAARDTVRQMEEISKKLDRIIDIMEALHQPVQQTQSAQAPQPVPARQPASVPQPVPQTQPAQAQQSVQHATPAPAEQPQPQPQPRVIPGRVVLKPLVEPVTPHTQQSAPQHGAPQQSAPQPAAKYPAPQFLQGMPQLPKTPVSAFGKPVKEAMAKNNLEFRIGANLLAIIGVLFVIVALVTFGITMLPDMVQGVFLYLIFIGLIAASELFVRKRLEKFSVVLTSLGLIGLYASTIVNYLFTHLLNAPLAIAATVVISVFAVLFSRKRDSFLMRLILHLGVIACFFPYHGAMSQGYFATITVLILAINLTAALLPVSTRRRAADLVQVISMTLFALVFMAVATRETTYLVRVLPLLFAMVVTQVILLIQKEEDTVRLVAFYVCHIVTLLVFLAGLTLTRWSRDAGFAYECFGTMLFSLPLAATLVKNAVKKSSRLWVDVFALHLLWLTLAFISDASYNEWACLVLVLICYASAALLHFKKRYDWQYLVVLIYGMFFFFFTSVPYLWIPYAVAVFVSLFFLYRWKTIVIALFSGFFVIVFLWASVTFPDVYAIVARDYVKTSVCALFLALMTLMPGLITRLRDPYTRFFNYAVAILTVLAHTVLLSRHLWTEYLILLAGGLIITLFLLKKEHGFGGINRYLALVIYLTYMIFMVDVELPVIISIALMILSIASVILGFITRQKAVRVYGLGLALLTCAKIAMYDFAESGDVSRITVFLVSGLLAIAISFIYIRLEKKGAAEKKEEGKE